jgi:AcrR family transcriptional regulator
MSEQTRQQIMDAVEKLIQLRGLARVTIKEIARETGLSEGGLYRHFEHKEDVFLAVLENRLRVLADLLDERLTGTGTVSHNLRDICLGLISYYEHLVPLTASFFADTDLLVRFRDLLQRIGGPERLHDHVAAYIEMEQRLGRIASELAAFSFAALLLGPLFQYAFLRKLTGGDPFGTTDRHFVESLLQTLTPLMVPSMEPKT